MVSVLTFTSCSDKDLYDQVVYNSILKESFPVDSIDPNQEWQTMGSADVSVYVNQNYDEVDTIKIYEQDPITNQQVTVMDEGVVTSGETYTSVMSYPLADSIFYVTLIDKNGVRKVQPSFVKNGVLKAQFGSTTTSSAKMRKAADATIPTMSLPYSSSEISSLLSRATEISDWTNNLETQGNTVYKITKNHTGAFAYSGSDVKQINYRVIVSGCTWTINDNGSDQRMLNGALEVIVANGGKIVCSGMNINNGGVATSNYVKITILPGCSIEGNRLTMSNGGVFYNGGTTNITYLNTNGGTFYNADGASFKATTLDGPSTNSTFINQSNKCTVADVTGAGSVVKNGCWMVVTNKLFTNAMIAGNGSYTSCGSFEGGGGNEGSGLVMGSDAYIQCSGNLFINNYSMTGPTSGYALFSANSNTYWNYTDGSSSLTYGYAINNLQFIFPQNATISYNFKDVINGIGYNHHNPAGTGNVTYGSTSSYLIPVGDCSPGHNASTVDGSNSYTKFGYRFCFEDQYPSPGDYDFNDVVMNVIKYPFSNGNKKKFYIQVSLDAVGATKQLAAAIRLYGVNSSEINSITRLSTYTTMQEGTTGLNQTIISQDSISQGVMHGLVGGVVLPLFNDAHYAISGTISPRNFYNTKTSGTTVTPKIVTFLIDCKNSSTYNNLVATNLDPFILYSYNSNIWEVHTYYYKESKVLYTRNAGASSVYPWAIMVPSDFRYPIEWQPITVKITNENSSDTGAYSTEGHSFAGWAKNKNTNTDWYKYPVSGKVY